MLVAIRRVTKPDILSRICSNSVFKKLFSDGHSLPVPQQLNYLSQIISGSFESHLPF